MANVNKFTAYKESQDERVDDQPFNLAASDSPYNAAIESSTKNRAGRAM